MASVSLFLHFLLAIALGALIGLERERFAKERDHFSFGGIRTFSFISLLGAISFYISELFAYWFIIPIFLSIVVMIAISYYISVKYTKGKSQGLTAEIVAFLAFFFGVLAMGPDPIYSVILTIIVTAFLYNKENLHTLVHKVSKEEMYSTLIFFIVAFVVLPFLPNKGFGPYELLNFHTIWLMVVFISGLGFIGYVLMKVFGSHKGVGLTGLLGGLVSSTAVTLSFATKSKTETNVKIIKLFVFATLIANTVMFFRVLIEVYVVNSSLLPYILGPLLIMALAAIVSSFILWPGKKKIVGEEVQSQDLGKTSPLSLGPALKFGILFGLVLVVVKLAQIYFGDTGIYLASGISGFVDVDAITLSMANLAGTEITAHVASRAIIIAVMSNTLIKFGYAFLFGSKEFRNRLGLAFLCIVLSGIVALLFV